MPTDAVINNKTLIKFRFIQSNLIEKSSQFIIELNSNILKKNTYDSLIKYLTKKKKNKIK